MKIIIAIILVYIGLVAFTSSKSFNEAALLSELRKNIDNDSLLKGLIMNGIKSRAANMLLEGKINEEFYVKYFHGGNATYPWWEANRTTIKGEGK